MPGLGNIQGEVPLDALIAPHFGRVHRRIHRSLWYSPTTDISDRHLELCDRGSTRQETQAEPSAKLKVGASSRTRVNHVAAE